MLLVSLHFSQQGLELPSSVLIHPQLVCRILVRVSPIHHCRYSAALFSFVSLTLLPNSSYKMAALAVQAPSPVASPESLDLKSAALDIFSPTRVSPAFNSRFDLDLTLPHLLTAERTSKSDFKSTDSSELRVDSTSSRFGLTPALCAQDLIPRHSPLVTHKPSFRSNIKSTLSTYRTKKVEPLRLFISSRYKRTSAAPALCQAAASSKEPTSTKHAACDTKHPKALPSFQLACPDDNTNSSESEKTESEDADTYDRTPTLTPSRRSLSPVATPVTAKPSSAEETAIAALLALSLGK